MELFKNHIISVLHKALDNTSLEIHLEIPPNSNMGDFAFPCFSLSKEFKKNPVEIAKEISKKITTDDYISKVAPTGPYVNLFVNTSKLSELVLHDVIAKKEQYGTAKKKDHNILLEGFQPNTHKAFHIGHIRNALIGESLARILKFVGNNLTAVSYMGDTGAHVAKWIWYYLKFSNEEFPKDNFSKWAGKLYTEATLKSKENEEYKKEIHDVHIKLEDGDKELNDLWKKTRILCLDDFSDIFKELDCHIEKDYYESECDKPGKEMTLELEKRGIFKYSDGAIIADLEEYNLGVMVMLKSNGATLYSTKDLGLAKLKMQNHEFDESLYVVGSEQEHHFRQIFKILQLMNYPGNDKLTHISYGLVKLKSGKMSSRLGNVVLYDEFRDDLLTSAYEMLKERDLNEDEKKIISRKVAFAALKYTMLSQDSRKEIIFDINKALDFRGDTGPYILYSYTRIQSILNKIEQLSTVNKVKLELLDTDIEKEIILKISRFTNICEKAAVEFKPNHISNYLIELCHLFNEYYHKEKTIQDNKKLQDARVILLEAVATVIKNGLNLLTIDVLNKM